MLVPVLVVDGILIDVSSRKWSTVDIIMSSSLSRLVVSLALLSLFGVGCFRSAPPPSRVASPSLPLLAKSACEHPYYPIRTGYTATFKDSFNSLVDGKPTVDHYTSRVMEVGATSAKIDMLLASSGLHSSQEITCTDGVLGARAYVDLAGGNQAFKIETVSASGEYLPRDLIVGSTWQQSYAIVMRSAATSPSGTVGKVPDIHATVTIDHQAIKEESVKVPSGTYTAMVVVSHMNMKLDTVGGNGVSAQIPGVQFTSTEWWVRGVGLVKAQTQTSGGYTALAEAETIVIP